ncbi:hypothetical protein K1I81_04605 [Streptococcus sanguinis]|uniref:hypothetical protein n=1 Tax=Streptococcus sanguinis TaxID=1305 RepID=UPI001CBD4F8B|nr:hypothetical protein [Streptococcus sanguinis]MBZ2068338.1 hypothetical protein [Streptococcus sanguinis]
MFTASKAYSDFLIQIKNADAKIQKRKNSFLMDLAKQEKRSRNTGIYLAISVLLFSIMSVINNTYISFISFINLVIAIYCFVKTTKILFKKHKKYPELYKGKYIFLKRYLNNRYGENSIKVVDYLIWECKQVEYRRRTRYKNFFRIIGIVLSLIIVPLVHQFLREIIFPLISLLNKDNFNLALTNADWFWLSVLTIYFFYIIYVVSDEANNLLYSPIFGKGAENQNAQSILGGLRYYLLEKENNND